MTSKTPAPSEAQSESSRLKIRSRPNCWRQRCHRNRCHTLELWKESRKKFTRIDEFEGIYASL